MFLFKRSNGVYYLCYKDELGKRVFISTKEKKKPNALRFLSGFNKTETIQPARVMHISDLRKEVVRYVRDNMSKATLSIYNGIFNNLETILNNKPIKLIKAADIELYKTTRAETVKRITVNKEIARLNAIFNIAVRFEWLSVNPAKGIKKLTLPEREILSFSDNEIKLILGNIKKDYLKNIVMVALYTGLRLNELINLQWRDINLKERIIYVRNKPNFITKTGKIREIPISDGLNDLLKSFFCIEANVLSFVNPESYLFRNKRGYKWNAPYISDCFRRVLKSLNIHGKFHGLRHTFITNLVKSNVNLNYIRLLAGHTQISTTQLYMHATTNDLRNAVNQINL